MAEVNFDKLVKLIKGDDEITQAKAAERLGVSLGQLNMLTFCKAKVEAGVAKKAPATAKSVRSLRDSGSERWEMIAARTGLSVARVKALYEEAGGDVTNSYTGRGRNFNGGGAKPKAKASTSGRASGGKAASSKASGSKAKPKGTTAIQRRRTRAGASNPS